MTSHSGGTFMLSKSLVITAWYILKLWMSPDIESSCECMEYHTIKEESATWG